MNQLADEVALHQSTLTRVVEKLEQKGFVTRTRHEGNQRVVEVALTEAGESLYKQIDDASTQMIGNMLALVNDDERPGAVRGLEVLCDLLDPQNDLIPQIIDGCCCSDDMLAAAEAESGVAP
jgi:DNA-binding MarR family transcriptional regulator